MAPSLDLRAYGYIALWITLSAGAVMFNKYILDPELGGFPFPLVLTSSHMLFCSAAAYGLVATRAVAKPAELDVDTYIRTVLPIGVLFALTLWAGNSAYIYLSVSFIQMLKAQMPLVVYAVGCVVGTEQPSWRLLLNLVFVVAGIVTASAGEVKFVAAGVVVQGAAILMEAVRLTLVQVLLQGRGVALTPISTMYYVSPVCFFALLIPMMTLEAPRLADPASWARVGPALLLASAALAFCLNISVFLLVGRTSALTMPLAGILKDLALIVLSIVLYKSAVTPLQLAGYGAAVLGVLWYSMQRLRRQGGGGGGGGGQQGQMESRPRLQKQAG